MFSLKDKVAVITGAAGGNGDDELNEFLDFLVESAPSYVVLNCFGYNQKLKKIIKEKMNNIPVILAPTVLANSLREIVCV